MKTFSMSQYANESDLYKAKSEYYQSEAMALAVMVNKIMDDILPQAGKLCFQDYGLLNELLIKARELSE